MHGNLITITSRVCILPAPEFVLNPAGKSDISILHEYVQQAMRQQPRYMFEELENSQTPFSATVVINNVKYGTGFASSKKAAKIEAGKPTLDVTCCLVLDFDLVLPA